MSAPRFAELLVTHRDRIVSRFVDRVQRKDLAPKGVAPSLLVDHIPRFLDELGAELQREARVRESQDAVDTSGTARQHGQQRWSLGYDLEALIREYGVLRHCVLEVVRDAGTPLSVDEFDVFAKALSVGVAEAAAEYAKHRDELWNTQKGNMEFLSEAGQLLTSSLDYRSTLSQLTGLLLPRLADWCAIHLRGQPLEEMPLGHVDPAQLGMLRELYVRYSPPSGASYGYQRLMRTGEPELVADVSTETLEAMAQDAEHLALLRAVGIRSWLVVPLRVQGTLFGSLTLACSTSGRRYEAHDLLLAIEVGRWAAVAIDNARLYELSQQERSRVEAATRAKDEFVAMVSHELRTPLNAMLGWLRLMHSDNFPEAKRAHALDVIERNAQAQSRIVADLLDISRVITGKVRITPSQVDLSNIVDMALEGVRPAAEAKRIQIEASIDRTGAVMRGDGDRLQQVVWNLLSNAIKFTPKGGRVHVSVRRVESDIELRVEDNGEGIASSFLPHIFESFRQADSSMSRTHGGLGIGLSIAKHLVELHGGAIEAHSRGVGLGTTVVVRLPISPVVSATLGISRVPATQRPTDASSLPVGLQGLRVLVVDDEADARELVTYVLETCGIEVRAASSAAGALQELSVFTPHVIVSDIGMPHEDGYALIRSIRTLAAEEKRNLPVIALTAFATSEDRTRILVEGFNVHITKPVEPAALVNAIVALAGQVRR